MDGKGKNKQLYKTISYLELYFFLLNKYLQNSIHVIYSDSFPSFQIFAYGFYLNDLLQKCSNA